MSIPVLIAVRGAKESAIAAIVGAAPGLSVARRCADLSEALAAAHAGVGAVVLVSEQPHLHRGTVGDFAAAGVAVVGVPSGADAADHLRSLGIEDLIPADADAASLDAIVTGAARRAPDRDLAAASANPIPAMAPVTRGAVIAVWGPAGAPGRTTLATAMAYDLAQLEQVLLVDVDTYGGAVAQTLGLLDEAPGIAALARASLHGTLTDETVARHALVVSPGLRVLSGITRPDRWPELSAAALEPVWELLRKHAAVTIVDCASPLESDEDLQYDTRAPQRNGATLSALAAADVFRGVTPVFESYDYQARVEQKVGRGHIRLLAFGSSDLGGVRDDEDDEIGNVTILGTSRFHRIDLRAQYPIGPGVLEAGSGVGWETMGMSLGSSGTNHSFKLERFSWTGRINYRVELGEHLQLKAGFDFERQVSDVENTARIGSDDVLKQPRVMGLFTGSFVEAAFFSKQWTVVAGVRLDTWHLPPDFTLVSVDPRLEARFKPIEALTLRGSAGLAHQAPMLLISLPVSDTAALRSGLQEVAQFSLGAVGTLPGFGLEISGDIFYNHLFQARERSIIQFVTGGSTLDDRLAGNRWGRAYGLELMLRLPQQSRLFGWLSYTLMRSERLRRFALFTPDLTVEQDTTAMLPFAFDQTHTLNLTLGYVLPKGFKVSASFHLNTGRPESGEFSTRTSRLVEDPQTGVQSWAEVPLNQVDRLPAYARLDLRASKTITFSNFSAELYLDILNTLGIPEVYGYRYDVFTGFGPNRTTVESAPMKEAISLPIVLPTLGVKVVY